MSHYLAKPADQLRHDWIRRFDARFWTINFPRPMLAAATTTDDGGLKINATFLRANDLCGIIWESEDRHDHPLLSYATRRDYRGLVMSFRWRATGDVRGLDAIDGPTLTIEGRDARGQPRNWYVRLWNYAEGTPHDAVITLDFDDLAGGFLLPSEADAVWAGDIDRLFISLVGNGYANIDQPLAVATEAEVLISDIRTDGEGAMLKIGDAFLPAHDLRIATAYDDHYHLTPARLLRAAEALGYRDWINHYVGMSHFMRLHWTDAAYEVVTSGDLLATPARAWHMDFLSRAAALGYRVIQSLSFELFDTYAPAAWKQRDRNGAPAQTGWTPPSTLLTPTNVAVIDWLSAVATAFAQMAQGAGLPVDFQVGEPWWWTGFGDSRTACFYDAATVAAYPAETGRPMPAAIADVTGTLATDQLQFFDWLGAKLAAATFRLRGAVRAVAADSRCHLLFYAPQVLDTLRPELLRINMPPAWASPAWDVLQLEDYDFVIAEDRGGMAQARDLVTARLGYAQTHQHYFAGFVLNAADARLWQPIAAAAEAAMARGVGETFVWALPQVMRDGFTYFAMSGQEEDGVSGFHDERFPIAVGGGAQVTPVFSTQIARTASGHEQRNMVWENARLEFDAGIGLRGEDDIRALLDFFRARRGRAYGFRLQDPLDNASGDPVSPMDQYLGIGDGVQTGFALIKTYGAGGEVRRITRPVVGTVRIAIDGVAQASGWSLLDGGIVQFDVAPVPGRVVTAGYAFDVPVRFAEDRLEIALRHWQAGDVPSVPLIEIREG